MSDTWEKLALNVTEYIETARKAHEALRSRTPGAHPDEQSSADYKVFKTAVNRLWVSTAQYSQAQQIRSSIWKLTIDAEFFARLNDSEGFREAAEVWQQYTYLKQTMTEDNAVA